MLDEDLAALYGVETGQITRQVRRNHERFPGDFAFQLTRDEFDELKDSTAPAVWGGRRYAPWVFTEQGIGMLSSVLRSPQAIQVNIQIMRAFVELRKFLASHAEFRSKLAELEHRLTQHDAHFRTVFEAIRQLIRPSDERTIRRIGFVRDPGPE